MASVDRVARLLAVVALMASTIGCDRVTKEIAARELSGHARLSLASDLIRLEYTENRGGFLSLGADLPGALRNGIFTIGTGVLLTGLGVWIYRRLLAGYWALGPALLFAGGVANLLDRAVSGSVIDFMNVGVGSVRTGIFNVADVAITAGVAMLVAELARPKSTDRSRK